MSKLSVHSDPVKWNQLQETIACNDEVLSLLRNNGSKEIAAAVAFGMLDAVEALRGQDPAVNLGKYTLLITQPSYAQQAGGVCGVPMITKPASDICCFVALADPDKLKSNQYIYLRALMLDPVTRRFIGIAPAESRNEIEIFAAQHGKRIF